MQRHRPGEPRSAVLEGTHVERYGEGRTIVFVHGWRLDSTVEIADFEAVLSQPGPSWRRVYVDLPGMGRSAIRPELVTLSDYAAWLAEAVRALCPGQPVALAGTSTGADLALHGGLDVHGLMLRAPRMTADASRRDVADVPLPGRLEGARAAKLRDLWRPAEGRVSAHVQELREDPSPTPRAPPARGLRSYG